MVSFGPWGALASLLSLLAFLIWPYIPGACGGNLRCFLDVASFLAYVGFELCETGSPLVPSIQPQGSTCQHLILPQSLYTMMHSQSGFHACPLRYVQSRGEVRYEGLDFRV